MQEGKINVTKLQHLIIHSLHLQSYWNALEALVKRWSVSSDLAMSVLFEILDDLQFIYSLPITVNGKSPSINIKLIKAAAYLVTTKRLTCSHVQMAISIYDFIACYSDSSNFDNNLRT
jgi:hypothetical protein